MYIIKKDVKLGLVGDKAQRDIADKIGINEFSLSRILNGKQGCSKSIAYAITKINNNEDEILDYFDIAENGTTAIGISCKAKELLKQVSFVLGKNTDETLEEVLIEKLDSFGEKVIVGYSKEKECFLYRSKKGE